VPLFVLVLIAAGAGAVIAWIGTAFPSTNVASPTTAATTAAAVEEAVVRHRRLRRFVAARLDPAVATGVGLSLALIVTFAGACVLAVLAYLIRSNEQLRHLDNGVARWGDNHASAFSTHGLNVVTSLGTWWVIVPIAVVVVAVESFRAPSRWVVPFLIVLMAGEEAITHGVKDLADRTRPTLNPIAATLGPSFPSGHSATAAAFYAGVALLLARRRPRIWRTLLAGGAVAIAVAVAASRVLLDVHWLSDVVAGVMVGWGWFAIASIAFGGRLLHFGAPAESVVDAVKETEDPRPRAADQRTRPRPTAH